MGAKMSKNISNEKFDKELKKWLESFSREEWLEKLNEEKYLHELRKWIESKENSVGDFSFKYGGLEEDQGNFVWTKEEKDKFLGSKLNVFEEIFKEIPEAA